MDTIIIIGNVDWMRNDYISDVKVGGITYRSVEHAYQAAKFKDPSIKKEIANALSVQEARRIGRTHGDVQANWDDLKKTSMESIVRLKFNSNPILSDRLSKTGDAKIVMYGYDEYWGTGKSGSGENVLGKVLETVRQELQFLNGVEAKEEDGDKEPTLYDAILNNPDEDLAEACQCLYVGVQALMTLVDPKDFDAQFIASRTNVSMERALDAINKLHAMKGALADMKDLLLLSDEDYESSDEDEEDDEEGEPSDPWLAVFD